jgi:hypothetical protein
LQATTRYFLPRVRTFLLEALLNPNFSPPPAPPPVIDRPPGTAAAASSPVSANQSSSSSSGNNGVIGNGSEEKKSRSAPIVDINRLLMKQHFVITPLECAQWHGLLLCRAIGPHTPSDRDSGPAHAALIQFHWSRCMVIAQPIPVPGSFVPFLLKPSRIWLPPGDNIELITLGDLKQSFDGFVRSWTTSSIGPLTPNVIRELGLVSGDGRGHHNHAASPEPGDTGGPLSSSRGTTVRDRADEARRLVQELLATGAAVSRTPVIHSLNSVLSRGNTEAERHDNIRRFLDVGIAPAIISVLCRHTSLQVGGDRSVAAAEVEEKMMSAGFFGSANMGNSAIMMNDDKRPSARTARTTLGDSDATTGSAASSSPFSRPLLLGLSAAGPLLAPVVSACRKMCSVSEGRTALLQQLVRHLQLHPDCLGVCHTLQHLLANETSFAHDFVQQHGISRVSDTHLLLVSRLFGRDWSTRTRPTAISDPIGTGDSAAAAINGAAGGNAAMAAALAATLGGHPPTNSGGAATNNSAPTTPSLSTRRRVQRSGAPGLSSKSQRFRLGSNVSFTHSPEPSQLFDKIPLTQLGDGTASASVKQSRLGSKKLVGGASAAKYRQSGALQGSDIEDIPDDASTAVVLTGPSPLTSPTGDRPSLIGVPALALRKQQSGGDDDKGDKVGHENKGRATFVDDDEIVPQPGSTMITPRATPSVLGANNNAGTTSISARRSHAGGARLAKKGSSMYGDRGGTGSGRPSKLGLGPTYKRETSVFRERSQLRDGNGDRLPDGHTEEKMSIDAGASEHAAMLRDAFGSGGASLQLPGSTLALTVPMTPVRGLALPPSPMGIPSLGLVPRLELGSVAAKSSEPTLLRASRRETMRERINSQRTMRSTRSTAAVTMRSFPSLSKAAGVSHGQSSTVGPNDDGDGQVSSAPLDAAAEAAEFDAHRRPSLATRERNAVMERLRDLGEAMGQAFVAAHLTVLLAQRREVEQTAALINSTSAMGARGLAPPSPVPSPHFSSPTNFLSNGMLPPRDSPTMYSERNNGANASTPLSGIGITAAPRLRLPYFSSAGEGPATATRGSTAMATGGRNANESSRALMLRRNPEDVRILVLLCCQSYLVSILQYAFQALPFSLPSQIAPEMYFAALAPIIRSLSHAVHLQLLSCSRHTDVPAPLLISSHSVSEAIAQTLPQSTAHSKWIATTTTYITGYRHVLYRLMRAMHFAATYRRVPAPIRLSSDPLSAPLVLSQSGVLPSAMWLLTPARSGTGRRAIPLLSSEGFFVRWPPSDRDAPAMAPASQFAPSAHTKHVGSSHLGLSLIMPPVPRRQIGADGKEHRPKKSLHEVFGSFNAQSSNEHDVHIKDISTRLLACARNVRIIETDTPLVKCEAVLRDTEAQLRLLAEYLAVHPSSLSARLPAVIAMCGPALCEIKTETEHLHEMIIGKHPQRRAAISSGRAGRSDHLKNESDRSWNRCQFYRYMVRSRLLDVWSALMDASPDPAMDRLFMRFVSENTSEALVRQRAEEEDEENVDEFDEYDMEDDDDDRGDAYGAEASRRTTTVRASSMPRISLKLMMLAAKHSHAVFHAFNLRPMDRDRGSDPTLPGVYAGEMTREDVERVKQRGQVALFGFMGSCLRLLRRATLLCPKLIHMLTHGNQHGMARGASPRGMPPPAGLNLAAAAQTSGLDIDDGANRTGRTLIGDASARPSVISRAGGPLGLGIGGFSSLMNKDNDNDDPESTVRSVGQRMRERRRDQVYGDDTKGENTPHGGGDDDDEDQESPEAADDRLLITQCSSTIWGLIDLLMKPGHGSIWKMLQSADINVGSDAASTDRPTNVRSSINNGPTPNGDASSTTINPMDRGSAAGPMTPMTPNTPMGGANNNNNNNAATGGHNSSRTTGALDLSSLSSFSGWGSSAMDTGKSQRSTANQASSSSGSGAVGSVMPHVSMAVLRAAEALVKASFMHPLCPFLTHTRFVSSYVRFHYLAFIRIYHAAPPWTKEQSNLCHLHLSILLSLASSRSPDLDTKKASCSGSSHHRSPVINKFYQLRVVRFLAREINLEHEMMSSDGAKSQQAAAAAAAAAAAGSGGLMTPSRNLPLNMSPTEHKHRLSVLGLGPHTPLGAFMSPSTPMSTGGAMTPVPISAHVAALLGESKLARDSPHGNGASHASPKKAGPPPLKRTQSVPLSNASPQPQSARGYTDDDDGRIRAPLVDGKDHNSNNVTPVRPPMTRSRSVGWLSSPEATAMEPLSQNTMVTALNQDIAGSSWIDDGRQSRLDDEFEASKSHGDEDKDGEGNSYAVLVCGAMLRTAACNVLIHFDCDVQIGDNDDEEPRARENDDDAPEDNKSIGGDGNEEEPQKTITFSSNGGSARRSARGSLLVKNDEDGPLSHSPRGSELKQPSILRDYMTTPPPPLRAGGRATLPALPLGSGNNTGGTTSSEGTPLRKPSFPSLNAPPAANGNNGVPAIPSFSMPTMPPIAIPKSGGSTLTNTASPFALSMPPIPSFVIPTRVDSATSSNNNSTHATSLSSAPPSTLPSLAEAAGDMLSASVAKPLTGSERGSKSKGDSDNDSDDGIDENGWGSSSDSFDDNNEAERLKNALKLALPLNGVTFSSPTDPGPAPPANTATVTTIAAISTPPVLVIPPITGLSLPLPTASPSSSSLSGGSPTHEPPPLPAPLIVPPLIPMDPTALAGSHNDGLRSRVTSPKLPSLHRLASPPIGVAPGGMSGSVPAGGAGVPAGSTLTTKFPLRPTFSIPSVSSFSNTRSPPPVVAGTLAMSPPSSPPVDGERTPGATAASANAASVITGNIGGSNSSRSSGNSSDGTTPPANVTPTLAQGNGTSAIGMGVGMGMGAGAPKSFALSIPIIGALRLPLQINGNKDNGFGTSTGNGTINSPNGGLPTIASATHTATATGHATSHGGGNGSGDRTQHTNGGDTKHGGDGDDDKSDSSDSGSDDDEDDLTGRVPKVDGSSSPNPSMAGVGLPIPALNGLSLGITNHHGSIIVGTPGTPAGPGPMAAPLGLLPLRVPDDDPTSMATDVMMIGSDSKRGMSSHHQQQGRRGSAANAMNEMTPAGSGGGALSSHGTTHHHHQMSSIALGSAHHHQPLSIRSLRSDPDDDRAVLQQQPAMPVVTDTTYLSERSKRRLYHDPSLHVGMLRLLLRLMISPDSNSLSPLYSGRSPLQNKKIGVNVPFALHCHLNHPNNDDIIPLLMSAELAPEETLAPAYHHLLPLGTSHDHRDDFMPGSPGAARPPSAPAVSLFHAPLSHGARATDRAQSARLRLLKLLCSRLLQPNLYKIDFKHNRVGKGRYAHVFWGTLRSSEEKVITHTQSINQSINLSNQSFFLFVGADL